MVVRKTDMMVMVMQVLERVQRTQIGSQSGSHGRSDEIASGGASASAAAAAAAAALVLRRFAFDVAAVAGRLRRRLAADGDGMKQRVGG